MPRYKLTIEYDGSEFYGFQAQDGLVTIQTVLEEAIYRLYNEKAKVFAAGRTDSGVHASGQVIHFEVTKNIATHKIQDALNFHVRPYPISILQVEEKDSDFHARFSAKARYYRYIILNRRAPSVLLKNRAWHVKSWLNHKEMNVAAQLLLGKHDFSSFRAAHCQAASSIKTIDEIQVDKEKDLIYIDIKAPSFLYHMVRNIVGSLIMVGGGQWSTEDFKKVLEARNRNVAARTAPPYGLYFMRVDY